MRLEGTILALPRLSVQHRASFHTALLNQTYFQMTTTHLPVSQHFATAANNQTNNHDLN